MLQPCASGPLRRDPEARPRAAPEFLGPISRQLSHRGIAPDRDGAAACQTRRRARRFSVAAPLREFPAPLRAEIACAFQNFLRTSLLACARSEIRAPNIHGNA